MHGFYGNQWLLRDNVLVKEFSVNPISTTPDCTWNVEEYGGMWRMCGCLQPNNYIMRQTGISESSVLVCVGSHVLSGIKYNY